MMQDHRRQASSDDAVFDRQAPCFKTLAGSRRRENQSLRGRQESSKNLPFVCTGRADGEESSARLVIDRMNPLRFGRRSTRDESGSYAKPLKSRKGTAWRVWLDSKPVIGLPSVAADNGQLRGIIDGNRWR